MILFLSTESQAPRAEEAALGIMNAHENQGCSLWFRRDSSGLKPEAHP